MTKAGCGVVMSNGYGRGGGDIGIGHHVGSRKRPALAVPVLAVSVVLLAVVVVAAAALGFVGRGGGTAVAVVLPWRCHGGVGRGGAVGTGAVGTGAVGTGAVGRCGGGRCSGGGG
jgi:hypothetical protein